MDRFGPRILVEAGDKKLLFDAGRGAIQRMTQIKVGWQSIDGVFFTHLHSDHVVGFPDAWLTAGFSAGEVDHWRYGGRLERKKWSATFGKHSSSIFVSEYLTTGRPPRALLSMLMRSVQA